MTASFPTPSHPPSRDGMDERLKGLLEAAHRQWTSAAERRRMRAFGFRPAVEQGVLKREWHGLAVRVTAGGIRASRPGVGTLDWIASDRTLLLDGRPFRRAQAGMALVESLLELIAAYERWVEAREGREERIERGRKAFPDRRPLNALAETRRLQRLLHTPLAGRGR